MKDYGRPQVYQGIGHALIEVCLGVTRKYPTRKRVFYMKNTGPQFDLVMAALSREGLIVEGIEYEELVDLEKLKGRIVTSETLMVLSSEDDPVVGRKFANQQINEILDGQRIVHVNVSHSAHTLDGKTPQPAKYAAHLWRVNHNLALAFLGERLSLDAPIAESLFWEKDAIDQVQNFLREIPKDSNKEAVRSFEQKKIGGSKPFFSEAELRLYDRAVVFWEDLDGHALLDELANARNEPLKDPGFDFRFECTSLSRWGGFKTFDWLSHLAGGPMRTPEVLRGTVIFSLKTIGDPGFAVLLENAVQKILKIQKGS